MVQSARTPLRRSDVRHGCRHMGRRLHLGRTSTQSSISTRNDRLGSVEQNNDGFGNSWRKLMAGIDPQLCMCSINLNIDSPNQGVQSLPDYVPFKHQPGTPLREIFTAVKDDLLELLSRTLAMNPLSRCTASQALRMPYFSNSPAPTPPENLPRPQSNSDPFDAEVYKPKSNKRISSDRLAPMAKRLHFDGTDSWAFTECIS